MLSHKADVDKARIDGCTALYMAAQNGHTEVASLLLSHKADVDKVKKNGFTALMIAAQEGHIDVAALLLSHKADVDKARNNGVTALHVAAHNGHTDVVGVLIKCGADPTLKNKDDKIALDIAAEKTYAAIVKVLKEHTRLACEEGTYALKLAAVRNDLQRLNHLLAIPEVKAKQDENSLDEFDCASAVMLAASFGRVDCLAALLASGCDKDNYPPVDGIAQSAIHKYRTPIVLAALHGHLDCVKLLVEKKATFLTPTFMFGETPLAVASKQGHVECVRYLLTLPGMDAAKRDSHGNTALLLYLKSGAPPDEGLVLDLLLLDLPCDVKDGSPKPHTATRGLSCLIARAGW